MAAELIQIRDRFGVSASEALHGMPAWEYDLLMAALERNTGTENDVDPEREFTDPPVPQGIPGV